MKLAASLAVLVLAASPALAQPAMTDGGIIRDAGIPYTMQRETQGKLFFVDGTWWGTFGGTGGMDFYRFNSSNQTWTKQTFTGAHLTDDAASRADAHWDGTNLLVLYSVGMGPNGEGAIWLKGYTYSSGAFLPIGGFPVQVVASGAIDKNWSVVEDTNARLWISFQNNSQYGVISSTGTGPSGWTSLNAPVYMGIASVGVDNDMGSHGLVAFNGKIGLIWTECFNAPDNHTKFSWRADSNADLSSAAWSPVELCQEDATYTMLTDDHVCVRSFEGQVWCVSKSNYSSDQGGYPRFTLMRRDLNGNWSHWTVKTIDPVPDYSTRPIMAIDATNRLLYFFWSDAGIQFDSTPIDNPGTFSSIGTLIIEASGDTLWDCSTSQQAMTANTGLMVVADRSNDGWTMFGQMSLGTPTTGPLAKITVSPNPGSVVEGGSLPFTASGSDASGNPVSVSPTWTATGGTISSTGLYKAGTTAGSFTVTATSGSVSGSATVNVTAPPVLTSIAVTPNPASVATGGTQTFAAQGKDQNGNNISATYTWSATGGTITQAGVYTAGSQTGSFGVTATSGSVSGVASVTITAQQTPVLTTIAVTPNPASVATGGTQTFTAQGKDQNGNNMSATFTWSATGGTVTQAGVYTAGSQAGGFAVTATSGSVSGSASVTVTSSNGPPPSQVIVDNDTPGWSVISGTWTLHYSSEHYGGNDRTLDAGSGVCQWTTSLVPATYQVYAWWPEVHATSAQATYTVQTAGGPVTVTLNQAPSSTWGTWNLLGTWALGSTGTIQLSGGVNVAADAVEFVPTSGGGSPPPSPVLTTITVTPNPATVSAGASQTFTAQGFDQNGNAMSATYTWTATGGTITSGGVYTAGQTGGTFSVKATSGNVSGSATVNVSANQPPPQILTSVVVSPNPASTTPSGTVAFTAQAKDQNGNNMSETFMWTASAGTIDQSGHYTAPATTGSFTVTASSQGISGQATVNVQAAESTVIVDDSDAGWSVLSGEWDQHYESLHYGPDDHVITVGSTGTCQWKPVLATGTYDVYAWIPERDSIPSCVGSYTIVTSSGNVTVSLDQNTPSSWGTFVKLGSFKLTAGTALVQLTAAANQRVSADAMEFVQTGP